VKPPRNQVLFDSRFKDDVIDLKTIVMVDLKIIRVI